MVDTKPSVFGLVPKSSNVSFLTVRRNFTEKCDAPVKNVLGATSKLTSSGSGSLFYQGLSPSSTSTEATLPPAVPGLSYTFTPTSALANSADVVPGGVAMTLKCDGGDKFVGAVLDSQNGVSLVQSNGTLTCSLSGGIASNMHVKMDCECVEHGYWRVMGVGAWVASA